MGVPVYKRILDLFEAEGVNTLFGIPDPNFVHMFAEAAAAWRALEQGRAVRQDRRGFRLPR
jgi:hypothetical protein